VDALAALMRRPLVVGLLIGLLLGTGLGGVVSTNFYEYHWLAPDSGERVGELVNTGWEPVPGTFDQGFTRWYRRPRFRLGG
jgi:hypothetical protein